MLLLRVPWVAISGSQVRPVVITACRWRRIAPAITVWAWVAFGKKPCLGRRLLHEPSTNTCSCGPSLGAVANALTCRDRLGSADERMVVAHVTA
jgi:hypothetical protein